jgi:molybdopterin converting factor subunit 1
MQVKVKYFAALRDSTGVPEESIETNSKSASDLFKELNSKYNFTVDKENIKVAINESYTSLDTLLNNNDTIVFIPPVAGG